MGIGSILPRTPAFNIFVTLFFTSSPTHLAPFMFAEANAVINAIQNSRQPQRSSFGRNKVLQPKSRASRARASSPNHLLLSIKTFRRVWRVVQAFMTSTTQRNNKEQNKKKERPKNKGQTENLKGLLNFVLRFTTVSFCPK